MNYFAKNLLEPLFVFPWRPFLLLELLFYLILISQTSTNTGTWEYEDVGMQWYQTAPRVHEPKYMRLRMEGYQQAPRLHEPKDMMIWGCEDINKHIEYMSLMIGGCEVTRLQANTHEREHMTMQRCKGGHINLSI